MWRRVRQLLGEALSAEDDAAVLQELAQLERAEGDAEAAALPAVPAVPEVGSAYSRSAACSRCLRGSRRLARVCGPVHCCRCCMHDLLSQRGTSCVSWAEQVLTARMRSTLRWRRQQISQQRSARSWSSCPQRPPGARCGQPRRSLRGGRRQSELQLKRSQSQLESTPQFNGNTAPNTTALYWI
jgi:hypothetical protein